MEPSKFNVSFNVSGAGYLNPLTSDSSSGLTPFSAPAADTSVSPSSASSSYVSPLLNTLERQRIFAQSSSSNLSEPQFNAYRLFEQGQRYERGIGVEKNLDIAATCYAKFADAFPEQAKPHLNRLLESLKKAALEANMPESFYRLGVFCQQYGAQVGLLHNEAVKWYEKAAQKGHYPEALRKLAAWYHPQIGVEPNHEHSLDYNRRLAVYGDRDALMNLSEAYRNGWGVDKNIELAEQWRHAAAGGHTNLI